ncbi:MAG: hypothetical protein AMXMBFR66_00570 [Pseudomonadota bacterium]
MRARSFPSPSTRGPRRHLLAGAVALLGGCAAVPPEILPLREPTLEEMAASKSTAPVPVAAAAATAASAAAAGAPASATQPGRPAARGAERFFQTPQPPRPGSAEALAPPAGTAAPDEPRLETTVALDSLPLPVFVDTVFATILKRNVSIDPAVQQRKELVSLRSGKAQTASGLFDAAKAVLKSYGVAVIDYNGLLRVTPATGSTGYVPEVRRGRSLPEVPAALRPVFQIVDLQAVGPQSVAGWLRTVFGQRLQVADDIMNQAVIVSGQSDDVAAAIETIKVLDQPTMRGRASARIAPLFWSADEMARRLGEVLTAQGYSVGTAAASQAPIILLPVPPVNSVIVFARNDEILNHVLRWAQEFDQPAAGRGSAGYFTYAVRNLDAADLAKTLQDVMNPATGTPANVSTVRSRVVVNPASNTLIIQGSPTEYQQWFGLLQELDRPPRSALVTVTIAEIHLNTGEQLGFEWMLNQFQVNGYNVNLGTTGAFGTKAIGGLAAVVTAAGDSSPRVLLNALASTAKVRVLANPSVMARNGESASIQVGSEVPVVSSQQTTGTTTAVPTPGGGTSLQTGVLQTIQYRSTGVILKVRPVIHAGGRIDLDVEQEVSSASATLSGVTASPTIATRRISTKLSTVDGATVLLGGLMQETASNGDTGVPLLKDVPLLGNLFRSRNDTRDRTELVVLITPYVIADEFEARAITESFRRQYPWDASTPAQSLRPPRATGDAAPPAGAIDAPAAAARPYRLPPPGEAASAPATAAPTTPASGAAGAAPYLRREPASPNAPSGTTTEAGASKAAPVGPAGSGKPVSDPLILEELQKSMKRGR